MVSSYQSSDLDNNNLTLALRQKVISQLSFLTRQWNGANKRHSLQQITDLERAYSWLFEYAKTLGIDAPMLSKNAAELDSQYAYDKWDPLFAVGESLLGELAAYWRMVKDFENQATSAVNAYHKLFDLLWSQGFRGDMFPDAELPQELMPSYYIDYWRSKGSL